MSFLLPRPVFYMIKISAFSYGIGMQISLIPRIRMQEPSFVFLCFLVFVFLCFCVFVLNQNVLILSCTKDMDAGAWFWWLSGSGHWSRKGSGWSLKMFLLKLWFSKNVSKMSLKMFLDLNCDSRIGSRMSMGLFADWRPLTHHLPTRPYNKLYLNFV